MNWIKNAKADVVTISWWGQGSHEDLASQGVLDAANAVGLKVNFIIEPYSGRTPASVVQDMKYIYSKYGSNPAFYRLARSTQYDPSMSNRGVFFVFNAPLTSDWASALDSIRTTSNDGIVLLNMDSSQMYSDSQIRSQLQTTHADGLFNYETVDYSNYPKPWPKSSDYILVFAASPGYDDSRIRTPGNSVARENGAFYDRSWSAITSQQPEFASVLSFNEWHETTQLNRQSRLLTMAIPIWIITVPIV